MKRLAVKRLKKLLRYDSDTGHFHWRATSRSVVVGTVAGCLDKDGYTIIKIDRQVYRAHRLVWRYTHGRWPVYYLDHVNGNRVDNRLANLREATHSQNLANSRRPRNNTSGFKGVSFAKHRARWVAQIGVRTRHRFLGHFDTPEQAHAAYCRAAKEHFGEFARV